MEFIDLKTQYRSLKRDIDARVLAVLDHGRFIMGPEVGELESRLADYVGVRHAITCGNGTDAIQLALMAHGIGANDAVFVPSFTFSASAEPVAMLSATPVFVDIADNSYNICMDSLQSAFQRITDSAELAPRAVIAVDMFGSPANYPALEAFCEANSLVLIQDAAQSFGARLGDRRCGAFGDIATTSFFPAKPLGCYGDGGAVFTDNDELAEVIRSLRVHGKGSHKYENLRVGVNSRLDTIQAAVLLAKLDAFDVELEQRQRVREQYDALLAPAFQTQHLADDAHSAWAQYSILPNDGERTTYTSALTEAGIPSQIYYPVPLHEAPAYAPYRSLAEPCTSAAAMSARVFSTPMHPHLSSEQIEQVARCLLVAAGL